jgi:hypothetical protein
MWTLTYWRDVAERALKTAAQTAAGLLIVGDGVLGLLNVDWLGGLSVVGSAALLSVLTSLASSQVGNSSSAAALPAGRHSAP